MSEKTKFTYPVGHLISMPTIIRLYWRTAFRIHGFFSTYTSIMGVYRTPSSPLFCIKWNDYHILYM